MSRTQQETLVLARWTLVLVVILVVALAISLWWLFSQVYLNQIANHV